jgi:hypothetical protein
MENTIGSIFTALLFLFAAGTALAGGLDSTAAPTDPTSAMYTGEEIYNRLTTGAAGVKRSGPFADPAAGPVAYGHTLDDIMAAAPAADNTNGAKVTDVLSGRAFWGMRTDGTWGLKTGRVAAGSNVTGGNGLSTFTIPNGLYTGGKTATAVDANLVSGNIKSGVTIFGVSGSVIQASGTAAAGDVLNGKTFSNTDGAGTGVMPNNGAVTITPGAADKSIPAGYHNGSGTVSGDANLVTGNIKAGVTIFGVSGAPAVVDTSSGTAAAGDMLSGKIAYVNGAAVTGSVAAGSNVSGANGKPAITIPDGLYSGAKTATAVDSNLVSGNIKAGATIFNISGAPAVVDTSSGTATAGDIVNGKTAYVNGNQVTGARPAYTRPVPVNATGITTWRDASNNGLNVTQAGFPRQDADSRRGGFLFTKLKKETGAVLDDGATGWGCVHDGVTGLTWEVKTTDGGLHDWTWTYSWYNSDPAVNGGDPGTPSGGSCNATVAAGCDTEKFVNAVNAAGWCGYTDWRMPTVDELISIVKYGTTNPAIPVAWFPNTQSNLFWSGSPIALGSLVARLVSFSNGSDNIDYKSSSSFVRLVRGGR